MRHYFSLFIALFALGLFFHSCKKDDPLPPLPSGKVIFQIRHLVHGLPLKEYEIIDTNAAGNPYLITEVMYFISDITFFKSDGTHTLVDDWKDIFYIDENIPGSKTIEIFDPIPPGDYDSITFIFGITQEKNKSFMFVNPPEVNMFWPEVLGGGYHYLMINGQWIDTTGTYQLYNFHLGIGQLYHGTTYDVDSIYAFVQNYFSVNLPSSAFTIQDKEIKTFQMNMNIENWFDQPHVFDFNRWGGAIMQNQAAMQIVKENGKGVFTISSPLDH